MESWELEAREEIRELVNTYPQLGDSARGKELAGLFEEGATIEFVGRGTFVGREEIAGMVTGIAGQQVADPSITFVRHHISNVSITVQSRTEAIGSSYWLVTNDNGFSSSGRYRDTYRRRDGGPWLIATRYIRPDKPDKVDKGGQTSAKGA
jgi:hypothetical protein